jgi:geranylgeranyl pyrophosphate synthase
MICVYEKGAVKNKLGMVTEAFFNQKDFTKLLNVLSLYFQIRDDYINLTDLDYWRSKGFCQDFDEGKISYLVTYFKTMSDENIVDMMNDKTKEGKIRILELFCNHGLFDIVYNKLVELKEQILSEMNLSIIFEQLPFHKFNFNDINLL